MIQNNKAEWMDVINDMDYYVKEDIRVTSKIINDHFSDASNLKDLNYELENLMAVRQGILDLANQLLIAYPNEVVSTNINDILKQDKKNDGK